MNAKSGPKHAMKATRREFLAASGAGLALAAGSRLLRPIPVVEAATTAPAQPQRGGRLVFATKVDGPNLDPHMEISDARMRRSMLMYDALVDWGDDLSIRPGLAERFEPQGTHWVFQLRKGAQFSNGKEIVADDVVYSFQRILQSPGQGFYNSIKTAKATGKYTVEFELAAPSAPLLAALGGRYAYIIPRDGDKQMDLKKTALGSGPFVVKEFVQNQRLVLQKNPNSWHAKETYVDELVIQIIPDEASTVAGLRSGEVHLVSFEDAKNYLLTKDDPNLITSRSKAIRWDILDFPLDTPPYNDVKLRQAIALALDRETIMAVAISGLGTLLGGHSPALWAALPPEQDPFFKRDIGRAKRLIQETGLSTPLKLTLRSIVGYSALNAAAQVIVENLREIGIVAEIHQVDLGIWIDDFLKGKFRDFSMNSWGGWVDPDILYYNHFHKPPQGKDFRRWNNDQISAMLDKGRTTLDRREREKIYLDIQKLIAEQCPWIPLYSADVITAQNKKVNYRAHPSGYYHNLRGVRIQA